MAGGLLGAVAAMTALCTFRPDVWQIPAIKVVLVGGSAMFICLAPIAPLIGRHMPAVATNAIRPWLGKLVFTILGLEIVLFFALICARIDFPLWPALLWLLALNFALVLLISGCRDSTRDDSRR